MTSLTRQAVGRLMLLMVVVCGAAFLVPPPAQAQAEDDVFEATKAAFIAAETSEARLAIIQEFLAEHPDHPQVVSVLEAGADFFVYELEDPDGAIKLVENQLPLIGDSEMKAEAQHILLGLYTAPEHAARLEALVGDLYDPAAMTYVEHLTVIRAAAGTESWSMVDHHCAAAAALATPEAFRAAYPESDFSDEYIQEAGKNRQGLLKTYSGWSAANRGDEKQAKKDFKEAAKLVRQSYFGLPDNELYFFWGKTLVKQGKVDKGLEMLALAAIYGNSKEAKEAAHAAFDAQGKNEESFDDFLWNIRVEHAPDMEDFTALDYQAAAHSFNDLRGKKATLLAFWFPT